MSAAPCWIERREADARYDYAADTFDENAPLWSPNCRHAACLNEDARHKGGSCSDTDSGYDCPMAQCRWDTARAMCDLDKGHTGAHVFVPSNEIVLEFPPATDAARGDGGHL